MTTEALLFTISAIGISETAYLIQKRLEGAKPICVVGTDCSKVLESPYRKTFLIPNEVLGIVFYTLCSFIASLVVIGVEPLRFWGIAFGILIAAGSVISLYFVYLQYAVIKAWCFWCVMSACTIWLMGGIILLSPIV